MKIAIVILNWNGVSLLERFLPDVLKYSEDIATVYVADNASSDDSVAYVTQNHPTVKIIQNKSNGGYAKGYNDALKRVEADLYVLLNSDIAVKAGWLQPMVDVFTDPRVGAAQPKIKDHNKPNYFEYAGAAGGFLDSLGYPFCRGRIFNKCEEDLGQYDETIEVQWASGACLFVRSVDFWRSGAFDETYFAHQEEIDLCWRIKNLGQQIIASGASEVLHVGGATLSTAHPKKTFYNFRNSLFNVVKNVQGFRIFVIIFTRLLLDGIAGIQFLFEGKPKHTLAILKAHLSFYYHLRTVVQQNKTARRARSYSKIVSIIWSYFISRKRTYTALFKL